jgi:hypothetical protein
MPELFRATVSEKGNPQYWVGRETCGELAFGLVMTSLVPDALHAQIDRDDERYSAMMPSAKTKALAKLDDELKSRRDPTPADHPCCGGGGSADGDRARGGRRGGGQVVPDTTLADALRAQVTAHG